MPIGVKITISKTLSINEFIESVLDIVILHNSDGTLLGLEIMMTCGGPTLWIETRYSKVVGVWGIDRFERNYTDGLSLDELFEDIIYKFN